MKKFLTVLQFSVLAACLWCQTAAAANNDYLDAKVTGVGIYATGPALKFTLDKTGPLVWTTDLYTDPDQLKNLVALIMVAYTSQTKIAFIRTFDDPTAGTPVRVAQFEMGTITH